MTTTEISLFASGLVCWMEHRVDWETADVSGIEDGIERIAELSKIEPSASERSIIVSLYHEMLM